MATDSDRQVLWNDLRVTVYGPTRLERDRAACARVEELMAELADAAKRCFRDCVKRSPVLEHFRVEVQK